MHHTREELGALYKWTGHLEACYRCGFNMNKLYILQSLFYRQWGYEVLRILQCKLIVRSSSHITHYFLIVQFCKCKLYSFLLLHNLAIRYLEKKIRGSIKSAVAKAAPDFPLHW